MESSTGRTPTGRVSVGSATRINTFGDSEIISLNKGSVLKCDLPTDQKKKYGIPVHHFRLLHPLFPYPTTIVGREEAVMVNLEEIRCIITAYEVLIWNSREKNIEKYVKELELRLRSSTPAGVGGDEDSEHSVLRRGRGSEDFNRGRGSEDFNNIFGDMPLDHLPFEFRVLVVALEAAYTFLHSQAEELVASQSLLPELTSKINKSNSESVQGFKSKLAALTRKVQKVEDAIKQLLNDEGKLAEMYLTRKKQRMESTSHGDQSLLGNISSVSAPDSTVASPLDGKKPEKGPSIAKSWHEGMSSSESAMKNIELEMLLEQSLAMFESTSCTLTTLKQNIEEKENNINIQLDRVRNKLIQYDLLMTTLSFVFTIFGMVTGIFGMNFQIQFYHSAGAFKWVLIITGATGITTFLAFCWFFKSRRLM